MSDIPFHEAIHVLVLHGSLTAVTGDSNIPHYRNGKPGALQVSYESWSGIVQTLDKILDDIRGKALLLQKIIIIGFLINCATIAVMTAMGNLEKLVLIGIFTVVWMGPFVLVDSLLHKIVHKRVTVLLPTRVEGYNVEFKTKLSCMGPISYLNFTKAY